jgi:branched-chain amino acid transport system ATP-binding protein
MAFWRAARRDKARYERAAEVAERVGLGERLFADAGGLSHGEQRQLEVGLALAVRPQLLLLDEPMAGMGPDETERMVALLTSLKGHTTLLLVEHDMDAVFRVADRITVMVNGSVIASDTPEAVRSFLSPRLAGYKVPRTVTFHEQLPREDSGKIFKRQLREPYWAGRSRRV